MKVLEIEKNSAKATFTSWKCTAKDVYNWDQGKSVVVPGYGNIDDEDALCLEKAGRAKSFEIKSEPWDVKDKDIIGEASVDLS